MTSENAILDKLVEKRIITREQIREVAETGVDDTMNSCAELMHTLLCSVTLHIHSPEELQTRGDDFACYWYAEQAIESCWQEPDHELWLNICADEMVRQEFKSSKELHDFLLIVTKAAAEIHFLKQKYPHASELLRELL